MNSIWCNSGHYNNNNNNTWIRELIGIWKWGIYTQNWNQMGEGRRLKSMTDLQKDHKDNFFFPLE